MFTRIGVAVSILCLVVPAAAFAQGFVQGDRTLALSGTGANDDGFSNFIVNIEGKLGYFFTDRVQGSFQQGISFIDVPGSDDDWLLASRFALDYVWGAGQWWPFVGANVGYLWGDRVRDVLTFGPQAGVHYFVNNTTFVLGQIQYEIFTRSGGSGETFDDDRWVYTLGIGFRW